MEVYEHSDQIINVNFMSMDIMQSSQRSVSLARMVILLLSEPCVFHNIHTLLKVV